MLETPNPPNSLVYQAFSETFVVTGSVMRISSEYRAGCVVERRELHIQATPQSKSLKRELGLLTFRIVENTTDSPKDKNDNPIVGGVNTFPEPHVLLFLTPASIVMLNQRASAGGLVISICPGVSLAEWDQADAIPIYEATFFDSR